jgi:aspartyl-tRNA(Asn)/glutamyl-tRNA(Gln) amidotransferase subunit A
MMRLTTDQDVKALSAGLSEGAITSRELTEAYLHRIDLLNPKLGAVTELNQQSALLQAESIDLARKAGVPLGGLAGIPVLVKDLYYVDGYTTTAGSRLDISGLLPPIEGPFVKLLRQAGCILLGKTRTTEFAMGGVNFTHTMPWNPADMAIKRMTGGSSHGSAVAMASDLCGFSIGSDTGGSVRQPAAFTGVAGLKVRGSFWSTKGVFPLSSTLDSLGLFAKSAHDLYFIFEQLESQRTRLKEDPGSLSQRPVRLALPTNHFFDHCTSEVQAAFQNCVSALQSNGIEVVPIEIPETSEIDPVFGELVPAEALAFIGLDRFKAARDVIDPVVWQRASVAFDSSAVSYLRTLRRFHEIVELVRQRLRHFDGWISPTVPATAPAASGVTTVEEAAMFNRINTGNVRPGNLFDHCGISIPILEPVSKLPAGFQLMSGSLSEHELLNLSCRIEKVFKEKHLNYATGPIESR